MSLSVQEKIDRFGHCLVCGDNLLTKRIVNGKVVDMFLPTYSDTMFLLDSGSQMQITICKSCKDKVDLNDPKVHDVIMKSCMKGWELESKAMLADETKPEWTQEVCNKYLDDMSKLSIHCNSDDLDKYAIQTKIIQLRNMKVEEISEEKDIEVK